jgi:hypothetical protein
VYHLTPEQVKWLPYKKYLEYAEIAKYIGKVF